MRPKTRPKIPWARLAAAGLAEPLGEPQRLLRRVDREHVVAGVHVERRRLLVEADELDARRAVLEQVDAALVVLDRALAIALLPEPGADLAVQVADPGQVLLAAVVLHALAPRRATARSTRPSRSATSPSFSAIRARVAGVEAAPSASAVS